MLQVRPGPRLDVASLLRSRPSVRQRSRRQSAARPRRASAAASPGRRRRSSWRSGPGSQPRRTAPGSSAARGPPVRSCQTRPLRGSIAPAQLERPRRAPAQAAASRLALGADREPIRPELWHDFADLLHEIQDRPTTDLGAFVAGHRDRRVLSRDGRDLSAGFGKRHFVALAAELPPKQIERVRGWR